MKITEKDILNAMQKLGLSREEAIEMLEEDDRIDHMKMSEVDDDLTEEQRKAVKKARQGERKKSTSKPKREKKVDNEKKDIIKILVDALGEVGNDFKIINDEREFEFLVNETKYKITLAKPRK